MKITARLARLTGTTALVLGVQMLNAGNAWATVGTHAAADTSLSQALVQAEQHFNLEIANGYEPPDNGQPDSSDSSGTM